MIQRIWLSGTDRAAMGRARAVVEALPNVRLRDGGYLVANRVQRPLFDALRAEFSPPRLAIEVLDAEYTDTEFITDGAKIMTLVDRALAVRITMTPLDRGVWIYKTKPGARCADALQGKLRNVATPVEAARALLRDLLHYHREALSARWDTEAAA